MNTIYARVFRRSLPGISFALAGILSLFPLIARADSPRVIESTATTFFTQNQSDQALAYLEAQILAVTPAEKDLAVAQELTRIAFIFHNKKDRPHAEFVATLGCTRAQPRLTDAVLSPAHFGLFREQALACELILGDLSGALTRVDAALRYIAQLAANPALDQPRAELLQRRQRLLQRLKIQQRPPS